MERGKIMISYEVRPGDRLPEAIVTIIEIVNRTGETVTAEFGIGTITAYPGDKEEAVIERYERMIGYKIDRSIFD